MRLLAGIDLSLPPSTAGSSTGPFPDPPAKPTGGIFDEKNIGAGGKGRTDSVPDPNPSLQGGVRGRFLVVY